MLDLSKVPSIPSRPEEISKSVAFKKEIWNQLKTNAKKNKHTLKQALEFGINAYLAAYKTGKK